MLKSSGILKPTDIPKTTTTITAIDSLSKSPIEPGKAPLTKSVKLSDEAFLRSIKQ